MKDFVRDVWKIAAACATGAFLLSLVIGLIAGNPFGIAFFRALLFALLFAGMGAGLRVVVKGYLPELIAPNPETAGAAADAAKGRGAGAPADHRTAGGGLGTAGGGLGTAGGGLGTAGGGLGTAGGGFLGASVDIVLPEDDGLRRQAYSGTSQPSRASTGEPGEGEPVEELDADSLDEDSTSQAEAQALGEFAEELAEELPGSSDNGASAQRAAAPGRHAGSAAAEEAAQEAQSDDELPRSARESAADLDSLPDIAGLEPSSSDRPGPSMRAPRIPTPGERPADAVKEVLGGQDPSTLARAIRTVLKKEEKG